MGRTLKVGIVMGGGVSLGSFNGGALAELMRQLRFNLNPDRWDDVKIDVLFGASAGGMTLGLLLRTLANPEGADDTDVVASVRERQKLAWVEGIGLSRLIPNPAMKRPALLDRGAVDSLGRELLCWHQGAEPNPMMLSDRVCLGITLLNYNGIPIRGSEVEALADAMSTTLYRDYRIFCLDLKRVARKPPPRWVWYESDQVNTPAAWREIAATAIAGGAFPLAFEPVVVQRKREEYGRLWPPELDGREDFPFTFGDGGTFNNEPLREAMQIIGVQDAREKADSYDRILVYVDPSVSGLSHDFSLSFHLPLELDPDMGWLDKQDVVPADAGARFMATAGRFVGAVLGQAAVKDFLAAEKVNNRLHWRDNLRQFLAELLPTRVTPDQADRAEAILRAALAEKKGGAVGPGTGLTPAAELDRVCREETGRGKKRSKMSDRERLLYSLLSTVDQVAALRGKQRAQVIAIGPTQYVRVGTGEQVRVELAGNFLANFGGFFRQSYREYDFKAGEAMAGSVLASVRVGDNGNEVPLLQNPDDRPEYERWIGPDPSLDDVPERKKVFMSRLGELMGQIVRHEISVVGLRDLAAAVVKRLSGYVAGLAAQTQPEESAALLRIVIEPADTANDEFYLEGQKAGDDTAVAMAGDDGTAALHTLLFFTLAENSEKPIRGPHVTIRDGKAVAQLAERQTFRDDRMWVRLPTLSRLANGRSMGLATHTVRVNWNDRTQGPWRTTDGLKPLVKEL